MTKHSSNNMNKPSHILSLILLETVRPRSCGLMFRVRPEVKVDDVYRNRIPRGIMADYFSRTNGG